MKFARHILACLFLVASLASAQETYESFAAAYGAANTLRNQKKFDEAFAAADAAIAWPVRLPSRRMPSTARVTSTGAVAVRPAWSSPTSSSP